MKCYFVRPVDDIEDVTDWLNKNKISYNIVAEDNIIYANMKESSESLEEIAKVTDPVIREDKKWFFICDDQNEIDVMGSYKTEHDARVAFKKFISGAGEFVDNK